MCFPPLLLDPDSSPVRMGESMLADEADDDMRSRPRNLMSSSSAAGLSRMIPPDGAVKETSKEEEEEVAPSGEEQVEVTEEGVWQP